MTPAADQSQRTVDATAHLTDTGLPSAASSEAAAVPGYELAEEVGRGGMGVVVRARDLEMGREVAVKLLQDRFAAHSSSAERFVEEARITGQLQHPGIPPIYRVGRLADGRPFLAMKLIRGRTLDEMLKSGAEVNTLAVFEAVAQAVGYAHAHGVIHRDLKPANVMVGSFGEVQVMDWGLAKVLPASGRCQSPGSADPSVTPDITAIRPGRGSGGSETQAGSVLGTPAYMAPEQAAGEIDRVDQRSDVFGLGAILCVLLTGRPPFTGADIKATRQNAARGRMDEALARLAACAAEPEVVALCRQCLSFEPADRPADGNAVAAIVAQLRVAADERARRAEVERGQAEVAAAAQAKRRRLIAWGLGGLAAALLLGVIGTWVGMRRAEAATALTAERLRQIETINAAVFDIFAGFDVRKVNASGKPVEAVLANRLIDAGKKLDANAIQDELVVAGLHDRLGQTLVSLGRPNEAIEFLSPAASTRYFHLGIDHPDTLVTTNNLALAYEAAGRLDRALSLFKDTLQRSQSRLGPDHPDTLKVMGNLADAYRTAGRPAEAVPLYEDALRRLKPRLGPDHPDTLTGMGNLAIGYQSTGRFAEAVPLHEESLRLRKVKLGPDHPDTLASMNNLAEAYRSAGRLADALPLIEGAQRLMKAKLGPDHPDTLVTMNNLADAYISAGRPAEAFPLFEEALRLMKARQGPDHPDTLASTNNLADAYRAAGRLEEALPLFEAAARGAEKRGFQLEHAVRIVPNTSAAYEKAGRWSDAARWRRAWADHLKQTAGPDSAAYAGELAAVGVNLMRKSDWPAAETALRECLAIRTKTQPDDWRTFNTQSMLGAALLGQKRYADAAPLLTAGYEGMAARASTMPKAASDRIAEALDRLIELSTATDKPGEAAKYRELRAKHPPPKQP